MPIELAAVEWSSQTSSRFWWIRVENSDSTHIRGTVEKEPEGLSNDSFWVTGRVVATDFGGYRRVDARYQTIPVEDVLSVELLLDDGYEQKVKHMRIPCAFYRKPFMAALNVITISEEQYPDYKDPDSDYEDHEVVTLSGLYAEGEDRTTVWLEAGALLKICIMFALSEEVGMQQE